MFVAEAEKRDHETRTHMRARQAHEKLPQLVDRHVGRVDDLVREVANDVQSRAFVTNPFGDRPIRRERMRPACFAEAADERRVARFEEDQHRIEPGHFPQPPENLRERRQKSAFADVDHDCDFVDAATGPDRQPRERGNQRRRQIVDAEVPEIFERANRLRLAGARQSRQDDERLPRPHALRNGLATCTIRPTCSVCVTCPPPHRPPPGSSSSSSSSAGGVSAVWRSVCSRRSASARAA